MPSFPAGRLDKRVEFQRKLAVDDTHGNVLDGWECAFNRWTNIKPDNGSEKLEAGRLESGWRAMIRVRRDSQTKDLTAEHRLICRSAPYDGEIGNIRSIVPAPDRAFLIMTVDFGRIAS